MDNFTATTLYPLNTMYNIIDWKPVYKLSLLSLMKERDDTMLWDIELEILASLREIQLSLTGKKKKAMLDMLDQPFQKTCFSDCRYLDQWSNRFWNFLLSSPNWKLKVKGKIFI